ncbi:MAG TPA: tRNA pseudouridine(38-40) synthase TruA [Povalibacter sp.]|uniref:tRNA pseudouridine(38-40) synthase TruA n=1 Tax=Povalibacter sp. TaxID=1962978 RepID=UPI002C97933A|nr:tRNA pseudouridine(38-40) synthase TruA [Povalibacter sp.]HMN45671.1 tRNA pseudouridine(38-40) synthase TruA [Povalibacter sp.]
MPRIALGLEYDGSTFAGWQSQSHARGIQSAVEAAVAVVADHPVEVTAAGRTDAGVHAAIQVVHFDSPSVRSERNWVLGTNTNLPTQVSALWAREVPDSFHARYSAMARSYRYLILNRPVRPALRAGNVTWVRDPLDHERMHAAAQQLVGEHDFSSFRAAECQSRSPTRRLQRIQVRRQDELLCLDVTANAFLHHMVRNIAGTLIAVGKGDQPVEWVADVLAARDRRVAGITAPPDGLYLAAIQYEGILGLPSVAGDLLGFPCPSRPDQV